MEFIQTFILAIVQGLTEFLPISSSAHLILVPILTGWPDQGLAFDVAVHLGSLIAVVYYFRKDIWTITFDWFASLKQRQRVGESNLMWAVLFGTVAVGIAGLSFKDFIETHLRSPQIIASTTILFGLLLWYGDKTGKANRDEHSITWRDIFIIGCAQALALIPGTSRSGITITAGLMVGLTRVAAARYSFLLSVPVIILAGGLHTLELIKTPAAVDWQALLTGTAFSAVSAYLCITLFLGIINKIGMLPFVIYRLLLGLFLFAMFGWW
jgi:undecaprenyl-diphosphatase